MLDIYDYLNATISKNSLPMFHLILSAFFNLLITFYILVCMCVFVLRVFVCVCAYVPRSADRPLVAQFAASNATEFAAAAEMIAPYVDAVDLNCGCPQR